MSKNSRKEIENPVFDTEKRKKVLQALILLACRTFQNLAVARYVNGLFESAQIFFIFLIGMISLEVQKPNASWSASVNSVRL